VKANKSGAPLERKEVDSSKDEAFLDLSIPHSRLRGTWFLICAHKLRDKRCGVTGPILADELEKYAASHSLKGSDTGVHTLKISHIGGHKFAGNVIVYPSGVWYGRVTPCHVPLLVGAYAEGKKEEETKLKPLVRGGLEW